MMTVKNRRCVAFEDDYVNEDNLNQSYCFCRATQYNVKYNLKFSNFSKKKDVSLVEIFILYNLF